MATFIPITGTASQGDINLGFAMQRYPFIFSDERKWKIRRHVVFWLFWWLFQSFIYSFSAFGLGIAYFKRLPLSLIESFIYLIPHMFLAYSLVYWVVPKLLLKGKYKYSVIAVPILFIVTAFISSLIGVYVLQIFRNMLLEEKYKSLSHLHDVNIFLALMAGLRGAITIGGIAAAIKLMKYWYTKEQRNLQLQKENVAAQLQLLKGQVHPHFLFNTLNNIYSFTQTTSPVASRLVMGLSDMLRYMLYECNQPLVPLSKELKMIRDYIALEQVRYNNRLDVNVESPDDTEDLYIAPLLLIPFVENCFKHGTSQMLDQPWISLSIVLDKNELKMKLVNGKVAGFTTDTTSGIGINNVKKRLELIYPGKHSLRINNSEDVFVVSLKLQLEKIPATKNIKSLELTA